MKKQNVLLMVAAAAMVVSSVSVSAVDIQPSGWVRIRDEVTMKSGVAGNNAQRNRVRLAFQYGGKAMVAENVEAGFGISTLGDQRSLNSTFGTITQPGGSTANSVAFYPPTVAIEYAYIKHTRENVSFTFGRMKNPFFSVSQLIWDNDLRGDGVAFNCNFPEMNSNLTAAYYVLDEKSGSLLDSNMVAIQLVHSDTLMDMPVKGALTYYGTAFAANNSTVFGGTELTKELAAWDLITEGTWNVSFVEKLRTYTEFVMNTNAPSEEKNGALLGVNFGSKKLAGPGTWDFDVHYRYLQKDAFVAALVDSDFLGGATNVKGWTTSFKYAVDRDLTAAITYRQAYDIINYDVANSMVQFDLSTKF